MMTSDEGDFCHGDEKLLGDWSKGKRPVSVSIEIGNRLVQDFGANWRAEKQLSNWLLDGEDNGFDWLSRNFSSAFTLMRLRAKTVFCFWLHATTASLTVRCPQRYFHGDQRRI
ncbi:hypothetical protein TNCV_4835831 [Trichonephila clavipes]|nr:hypothetical protein TNCV_4835831 [Trichonephila clavipes]